MYLRSIVVAFAVLSTMVSGPQAATDDEKSSVIQNLGILAVAKRWCLEYQIDQDATISAAMTLVDISVEPYTTKFREARGEAEKMAGENGTRVFCLAAFKVFGPQGAGVMMKK